MLKASCLIALLAVMCFPILLPHVHLLFFLPYLVCACYRLSRFQVAWRAMWCGLLLDLLSSSGRFGLDTWALTFTAFLCYGLKRSFFEDKFSTLPLMTFLFSLCFSLITALLHTALASDLILSWRWVFTDLFEMAVCDALYAAVLFSLPFQLTRQIFKMRLYALSREKHRPSSLG